MKPRILLIPNAAWWVIGEMGKQIIARFSDRYDFYFMPEGLIERRPDLLRAMVPSMDAIHCLNESSIGLFQDYDPATLPPIATWIHHVTQWSPDHQMAVDRSAALTVCTQGWKDYLEKRITRDIKVTIIPHGVDAGFFRRQDTPVGRFGIPSGRFVIGFVGSKASDSDGGRKGTDVFLDVIRKAAARLPDLHVVFGGPGWDTTLAELKAEGISASATGYIRKSDLPALYSALDVYLLTSRVEGGPCTVFEAMACETAVVSTRVGAVPELIVDHVTGYSAEVDDRDGLLSALVMLSQSREERVKIGQSARAKVAGLSWAAVLGPLGDVYDELVEMRRRQGPVSPVPGWMARPERLLRAACAADALGAVVSRVRSGTMSLRKGLSWLLEMLEKESIFDALRGAQLLWGRRPR